MIASIHQPHFLPWLGYWNKVLASDVFLWLDSVQYRKNYFQNRTRILTRGGEPAWLTLPVHAPFGIAIDAVVVAEPRWRERVRRTVEQNYGKSPYFSRCWPPVADALEAATDRLTDVNYRTFQTVLELLGDPVRVVRVSELGPLPEDPTERLLEACRKVGANTYIAGRGGRNYLRCEVFEKSGIRVLWQEFDVANAAYPQGMPAFVGGLSVVDCLFHVGPQKARELIQGAWKA